MVRFAHGIEGEREAKAPFPSFACRQRGIRVVGFALSSSYPIFCRSFRQMRHGRNIFGAKLVFPHIAATNSGITFLEVATFMAEKRLHGLFLDVSPHYFSRGSGNFLGGVCVCVGGRGKSQHLPWGQFTNFHPWKKSWHLLLSSSTYHPLSFFPFSHSKQAGGGEGNADNQGWVGRWGTLLHRTLTKESRLSNSPTYFSNTM